MTNVLLVIDMLNDFCKKGGAFYSENAEAIIPAVKNLAQKRFEQGRKVIRVEDGHSKDDLEIELLGEHAMLGTWGYELIDELFFLKKNPNSLVVLKNTFDGFLGFRPERNTLEFLGFGPERNTLEEILSSIKPDKIEIVGVCTDMCVYQIVTKLVCLRNAGRLNRNLEIVVYEDCVATFDDNDDEGYSAEEKTRYTFYHLKKWFGVKIANSTDEE